MTVSNLPCALIKQCLGRGEKNRGGHASGLSTFIPVGSALSLDRSLSLSPIVTKGDWTDSRETGTEYRRGFDQARCDTQRGQGVSEWVA